MLSGIVLPFCWLSQLRTLCCVLRSSHDRTRSGDDEEISVWCIRAPHPRHLQLNVDGHVLRKKHTCGWGLDRQMVKWAFSFALSGEVSQSVRSLSNTEQDSQHTRHKEEAEGRIKTDQADI